MNFAIIATSEFGDAIELVKQFGPFFVAVLFFLWRDYKREDRLSKRINLLEDEQRKVILPLVKDCSAVIAKNTAVMERLEQHLNL
jgi:cbb3-type cytochrome oxidase subunit 3